MAKEAADIEANDESELLVGQTSWDSVSEGTTVDLSHIPAVAENAAGADDLFLPAGVGRVFRSLADRFGLGGMGSSKDKFKKETPMGG